MTFDRKVGSRAPLMSITAAVLALILLPSLVFGAGWSSPRRVTDTGGSRLDSMHQLAADDGRLHLVHPRIGSGPTDDRVVYQRSTDRGASWSRERVLFAATNARRHVVPNLAIAARGKIVVAAWRVNGAHENALFIRVSRDGGRSFELRRKMVASDRSSGIGVPAVAVGKGFIAVAWTNRANGKVQLRTSKDAGRSFGPARTVATTKLSIDCRKQLTDGLVGLAATDVTLHVAWSRAKKGECLASEIKSRTSLDRGKNWSRTRTVTDRLSYGWPELDARGRTVLATMQSPGGGLIVSRSARNGRGWKDRLLKAPDGFVFSAADVELLPDKKAMITFVKERIRKDRLIGTKVVSQRSANDGVSFKAPKTVVPEAKLLRMAPNIALGGKRPTIVLQSGQLDGTPRNLFATRLK